MKLEASSADRLVFAFSGGTNLDSETDHFIHDAEITIGDRKMVSAWRSWGNGEPAGGMTFHLAKAE